MSTNRRAHRRAEKLAAGTQAAPVPEKAKDTAVLRQLAPVAKEANARLASAEKMTAKANDHLLSAAILIAGAEATCKEAGIKFKQWVETNIDKSWDYTVRLVKASNADNPALAIADMRERTKGYVAKHREKKKQEAAASYGKTDTPTNGKREPVTPFGAAWASVKALDDKAAINLMHSEAPARGMALISKDDLEVLKVAKDARLAPSKQLTLGEVMTAFNLLSEPDQMKHADYVASKVGCTLSKPDNGVEPAPVDDPGGARPPFLDRGGAGPKVIKKAAGGMVRT